MEFKSKSQKGVQPEDVWAAADSLIAQGLRPTIERVRQKIGRGSPNTVSPMLEAWFGTLAARLGVNTSPAGDAAAAIPQALQQAVKNMWEMTLSSSQQEADRQTAQIHSDLQQARLALEARENELTLQEQVRAARHEALQALAHAAEDKAREAITQFAQAQALASKRDADIEGLRQKLSSVEDERNAERRRHDEEARHRAQERKKHEERDQATQRKLLEDIDRARQEAKTIRAELQATQKHSATAQQLLQQEIRRREADLAMAHELTSARTAELHALREALAVSNDHLEEFRQRLELQQQSSDNAIARLTDALSKQAGPPAAGYKIGVVRKIKRPVRLR